MASLCNSRYTIILLAVLLGGFSLLNRRAYPVHKEGCVVVTGASSGIGKDAALRLDELGYTVYAGVRKQKDIDALKKERPSLIPIFLDVTDDQQCQDAAKKVADDMKKENGCSAFVGLVNNAGLPLVLNFNMLLDTYLKIFLM